MNDTRRKRLCQVNALLLRASAILNTEAEHERDPDARDFIEQAEGLADEAREAIRNAAPEAGGAAHLTRPRFQVVEYPDSWAAVEIVEAYNFDSYQQALDFVRERNGKRNAKARP